MRVLLTGGSGYVGGFVAPALATAGHKIVHLARRPPAEGTWAPWSLDDAAPRPPEADALVHLAFAHVPGAYRGGEGDDPEGFLRRNRDGSLALFAAARSGGVRRIVLLSSRAVYGDGRRGETLCETDRIAPDSLYGRMKAELEGALGPGGVALRATGVYGRPQGAPTHKWSDLFAAYLAGGPIPPRVATEVRGEDVAAAVTLTLARTEAAGAYNLSDLMLDRADLLDGVRLRTGSAHPLPPRDAGAPPGRMATDRIEALGWRPGGVPALDAFLDAEFGPPRR